MRPPSEVLRRARELLACGMTLTPLSLDASGAMCALTDEGLSKYCVADALEVAAQYDPYAEQGARDVLERQLRLLKVETHLDAWVSDWVARGNPPVLVALRTEAEVLALFTRAHRHALTREAA